MNLPLAGMAFMAGLLYSAHCLGMCGGLVAALSMAGNRLRAGFAFQLCYHAGRLCTYALIGGVVGWLGSAIALTEQIRDTTSILLVCSDLFIVLIGLGNMGLLPFFSLIELEDVASLSLLQRALQRCLRLPTALAGFPLGLLLGFLPCGLVYTMALTAAQTIEVWSGALIMFSFGVGTLPALLLFGGTAQWLTRTARVWMLRGAGLAVVLMGFYNLFYHLQLMGVL